MGEKLTSYTDVMTKSLSLSSWVPGWKIESSFERLPMEKKEPRACPTHTQMCVEAFFIH